MPVYFVNASGNSANSGLTWALAKDTVANGLAAATTPGDIVVLQYDSIPAGDKELGAAVTWTLPDGVSLIAASNDGGSSYTPTPMVPANNWLGNSTTARVINLESVTDKVNYIYGLVFRTTGTGTAAMNIASTTAAVLEAEQCVFWSSGTGTGSDINIGTSSSSISGHVRAFSCSFRFGNSNQALAPRGGRLEFIDCDFGVTGTTPSNLLEPTALAGILTFTGCSLAASSAFVPNLSAATSIRFDRCLFSGSGTILNSQTSNPHQGSPEVWVLDSHTGDTHLEFGYYNGLGSIICDRTIKYTGSPAGLSWKVVTNSNASIHQPFRTPWIPQYFAAGSAITPRIEVLRDGSTTPFKDHEIWGEFAAKVTANSTRSTFYTDEASVLNRLTANGSNQATGAGTSAWEGDTGAWSGKCDSGSSIIPAEEGNITGRICISAALTLYIDPVLRT